MHLFLRHLRGVFDSGLESDSEEIEKKEILKEEDRSVEEDPHYYSDTESVVSKDGDYLRNGEIKDSLRKHVSG